MRGWHSWDDADLILLIKVQPRSRRNEFVDLQQDRLRVRITAPPVDDDQSHREMVHRVEGDLSLGSEGAKASVELDGPAQVGHQQTTERVLRTPVLPRSLGTVDAAGHGTNRNV